MMKLLSAFRSSEDGAVTIDWVLLTAAVLTLGILVSAYVWDGAVTMSDNTGTNLETATVPPVVF